MLTTTLDVTVAGYEPEAHTTLHNCSYLRNSHVNLQFLFISETRNVAGEGLDARLLYKFWLPAVIWNPTLNQL